MAANPMYQFNVHRIGPEIKLGDIDISFTNASLFMVISSIAILIIFNLGSKKKFFGTKQNSVTCWIKLFVCFKND